MSAYQSIWSKIIRIKVYIRVGNINIYFTFIKEQLDRLRKQDLTSTAQQLEQMYVPDSINETYGLIMCHKTSSDKL